MSRFQRGSMPERILRQGECKCSPGDLVEVAQCPGCLDDFCAACESLHQCPQKASRIAYNLALRMTGAHFEPLWRPKRRKGKQWG